MDTHKSEKTISLWEDGSRRGVTLRNLQTGRRYSFVLKHSFVIGRKKEYCDLQVTMDDRYMSGRHLRFTNEKDGICVEDLHTKNGTRINGRPVTSKTRIHSGDVLKMGKSEFEVTL